MTKYGGGLLLLLVAIAFCCGCMGGESMFSGGDSRTFGQELPDERSEGLTLDEALADLAISQNEEMISFQNQSFLAVRGVQMSEDGRAVSWDLFVRPENENRTIVLIYTNRGWNEYEWEPGVDYLPVDMGTVLSPDEIVGLHTEMLSEYFSAEEAEADIFLSNATYVATFYGPEGLYETFRFDAYTGEWMR